MPLVSLTHNNTVATNYYAKYLSPYIIIIIEPGPVPRSVNVGLIGGIVGGVLSVLITGIVVLVISCFCYRYFHAAKTSAKKLNL